MFMDILHPLTKRFWPLPPQEYVPFLMNLKKGIFLPPSPLYGPMSPKHYFLECIPYVYVLLQHHRHCNKTYTTNAIILRRFFQINTLNFLLGWGSEWIPCHIILNPFLTNIKWYYPTLCYTMTTLWLYLSHVGTGDMVTIM